MGIPLHCPTPCRCGGGALTWAAVCSITVKMDSIVRKETMCPFVQKLVTGLIQHCHAKVNLSEVSFWYIEHYQNFLEIHISRVFCLPEVDCGAPPGLPHSVMLWDNSSSMGSEVVYQCSSGYHNVGQGNGSVCTASGQWNKTTFLCQGELFLFDSNIVVLGRFSTSHHPDHPFEFQRLTVGSLHLNPILRWSGTMYQG